ncbi:MAG: hypothetical protein JWQ70_1233 [Aeromicrobium sp.]|nr:hypothetical protein [Aeromicrobium sp.]
MARISGLSGWVRRRARALPAIAWRDRRIAALDARVRKVKAAAARSAAAPSFQHYLFAERRVSAHLLEVDRSDRGTTVTRKLRSYSFAQSWGVAIPAIFGIWDHVEDIAWDELPDTVVIKSQSGTSSQGVFPLIRVADGWSIVTETGTLTTADIIGQFRSRLDAGAVAGPFIAEEFLGSVDQPALPIDVKIYTFYGEVGIVHLRSVRSHLHQLGATFRTLDRDGVDLGPVYMSDFHNPDLHTPDNFGELIACAERLSQAIPKPFVRVDLYDVDGQVVFGEFTPRPGGTELFPAALDERLGHLWERAQARLLNDVIDGADYALRFGPEPRELQVGGKPYLPDHGLAR